jgi:hypothetical protein
VTAANSAVKPAHKSPDECSNGDENSTGTPTGQVLHLCIRPPPRGGKVQEHKEQLENSDSSDDNLTLAELRGKEVTKKGKEETNRKAARSTVAGKSKVAEAEVKGKKAKKKTNTATSIASPPRKSLRQMKADIAVEPPTRRILKRKLPTDKKKVAKAMAAAGMPLKKRKKASK